MNRFEGKAGIVIGAGGGCGTPTALRLAEEGADLALAYLTSKEKTEGVADHVESVFLAEGLPHTGVFIRLFCGMLLVGCPCALEGGQIEHQIQMGHENVQVIVADEAVVRVVFDARIRNGWEAGVNLTNHFSVLLIRDEDEPYEILQRIEATKQLIKEEIPQIFEVFGLGKSKLAKMLSTVCIGDFTSVYLAITRGVDPTPVKTISNLKKKVKRSGFKENVIRQLREIVHKNG